MHAAMNAARILALFGAFNAAAAAAQGPTSQSYLVINNTAQVLLCSTRIPNGLWQPWFEVKPGANWNGSSESSLIQFQCRPPVAQVAYTLRPGQRYSLLQSGSQITLVEVTS